MGRIVAEGSNYKQFAAPGIVVMEVQPLTIIGERAIRVAQFIGDYNWGPENISTAVNDFPDLQRKFGRYVDGLEGYLDCAAMFMQSLINVEIIRATPADGSPTASTYTITNTHWYQDDAGSIVKFLCKDPTNDRPTNVEITDGSGSNKNITIKGPLYQIDGGGIAKFIYNGSGIGTGTTVTISDGSLNGSKIVINAGEIDEEEYDNVNMNEYVSSTYLVNAINSTSSLVRVERVSGMNVDTLPTNQGSTAMVDVVTEPYTNLDMNEGNSSTFIVDKINTDSDLVRVERLSLISDDTLPTNQAASAMTTSLVRDIVRFDAVTEGLNGNNIKITVQDGTAGTKTVIVHDLITEQTEPFSNLTMDDGTPSAYIVDVITSGSSLVSATRVDVNATDLLPRNLNTQTLAGGSNGGLEYSSLIAKDIADNNIVTFKGKYRGSFGNSIAIKIINNNNTSVNVDIIDSLDNHEPYKKLSMNPTSPKYLVDYINQRSQLVTVTRNSSIVDYTLPITVSTFTNMNGGSNGDPIDDLSMQTAIAVAGQSNYVDVISYGSQSHGTLNVNAIALKALVTNKRERYAVLNSPPNATHNEAIAFVDDVISPFVILTHPEQYFLNPDTGNIHIIAYSPSYTGRLASLAFESSPSRSLILGSLGNTLTISSSGEDSDSDKLTLAGISPIDNLRGYGMCILNGINTSGDETVEQISTVSMRAFIARNLSEGLEALVSKLHTKRLRTNVKSAIQLFLQRLFDEGKIGNPDSDNPRDTFRVDVSAAINTPAVIKAKTLIANVKVLLLAAADHILIRLEAGESVEFSAQFQY